MTVPLTHPVVPAAPARQETARHPRLSERQMADAAAEEFAAKGWPKQEPLAPAPRQSVGSTPPTTLQSHAPAVQDVHLDLNDLDRNKRASGFRSAFSAWEA